MRVICDSENQSEQAEDRNNDENECIVEEITYRHPVGASSRYACSAPLSDLLLWRERFVSTSSCCCKLMVQSFAWLLRIFKVTALIQWSLYTFCGVRGDRPSNQTMSSIFRFVGFLTSLMNTMAFVHISLGAPA